MATASFTINPELFSPIVMIVREMSKIHISYSNGILFVETHLPFDDEISYGPRMDRVENIVRGIDPNATRHD